MVCPLKSRAQTEGDFARGVAEFRAGNYSSAAELLERAETASPGKTDALLFEGKAFVHLSNFPAPSAPGNFFRSSEWAPVCSATKAEKWKPGSIR